MVHRLDLDKNIRPLIVQAPLHGSSHGRIVLDPGHGGSNLGTVSVLDRRQEKEFTLDWARRLAPLLSAQGWQVTLTRTNDVELSLAERVAIADEVQADLFVSLHFNSAAPNLTRSGVETYCLTPTGLPSTLVRETRDDPLLSYPNNRFDESNLQWAARIHGTLVRATGAEDRGIRRARFMAVIRDQERPAVLVEGGFLSHPQEARRIADPAHRQLLAEAMAAALNPATPWPGGVGGPQLLSTGPSVHPSRLRTQPIHSN
jgi:N-acetylmuramoyl-L-alanine amidase